jgi:hypothetical protein
MGHIAIFIISILWITLSFNAMLSYLPMAQGLKGLNLFVFFLIFMIGGPIFGINQILTSLLDCILPEGWDNDDFSQEY